MEELLKNAEDFMASGEDNLKKQRFSVAVSDFFKAIVIICDYMIYRQLKIIPKNHNERFSLLKRYFSEIYGNVSHLFEAYTKSYNFCMNEEEARKVREYANELKRRVCDKK